MTPLHQKMIRELELHRKAPKTVEAYVTAVSQLAGHYGRSPESISPEEVRSFLHYLITGRKLAFSSVNQKLGGIRFFYRHVLGRAVRQSAGRANLVPDAHLAALAIEHGLTLCSTDGDFGRFTDLKWENPLSDPA